MHIAHGEILSCGQNFHRFFVNSVSVEKEPANKRRGPYAGSLGPSCKNRLFFKKIKHISKTLVS